MLACGTMECQRGFEIANTKVPTMVEIQASLSELAEFMDRWKWLTLTRPTHILVDKVLETHSHIIDPMSSLSVEDHVAVLSGKIENALPVPIREFFESSQRLELKSTVNWDEHETHITPQRRTSAKKQHETSRLSNIVRSLCPSQSLQFIIDVGSGLGYVDRELCKTFENCEVLAIESEEARCKCADVANTTAGFGERIKQIPMKLQGSNVPEIVGNLSQTTQGNGCLIALHACGDLSPTSLRLFEDMPQVLNAVVLSCCYHKMRTTGGVLTNFPLSNYVKEIFASGLANPSLVDVSFLRLAAESTKEMWAIRGPDQLRLHARSVAYRALVEQFEHQNDIKFSKNVRKAVKPSSRKSWAAYVDAWVSNTNATRADGTTVEKSVVQKLLQEFYSEEADDQLVKKTLAFNTMKSSVQHLVELFVLQDRLVALMEAGFPKCALVRVSDPAISPRSIAIVVSR